MVGALPGGDIKVTYVQDFGINDNTYGTGAIGWPATKIYTFSDLTGSDKLEFRFFDKAGKVVLDSYVDTMTAATSTVVSGQSRTGNRTGTLVVGRLSEA